MQRPKLALAAAMLVSTNALAYQEQCFAEGWVDCGGGTVIAVHLGSVEALPQEPAAWRFEIDVEGEELVVECEWIRDCVASTFPLEGDRGPWAVLSENGGDEDAWVHIRAGYHYDAVEGSVVSLLPRSVRVIITAPDGIARAPTWEYAPDHDGADVACTRCEGAMEVAVLSEMAPLPAQAP